MLLANTLHCMSDLGLQFLKNQVKVKFEFRGIYAILPTCIAYSSG